MNARPTMPTQPWEIPDPAGDIWDHAPDEGAITAARNRARKPADELAGRVFMGRLNVSDLDYMAKAILQMCDENHELRERVRRLEERLGIK
jgi:hypothetical protein